MVLEATQDLYKEGAMKDFDEQMNRKLKTKIRICVDQNPSKKTKTSQ